MRMRNQNSGAVRKLLQPIFCILLTAALTLSMFNGTVFALAEWPQSVYTAAEGACVMDADSKVVLYGKNQDTAYYPASITKVMTALIVLENCRDLNELVTFSASAVAYEEENATLIGASEGDQLTVRDCLYALLFASANEVANALAEHVGAKHPELRTGSETDRDVFVRMMNDKAKALGCKGTQFNNPSGLTDPKHYTTAYDMCLILAAAIENRDFVEIESHTYWTHAPIKRYPDPNDPWNTVYPKHQMLKRNSSRYYPGVFAGKTGYTMSAGNTLVTACRRNGMTLVVTVLNGHNSQYNDTKRLLDFGYDQFQSLRVADYDTAHSAIEQDMTIDGLPVLDTTTLGIDPDSRVTLPKGADFSEVTKELLTDSRKNGEAAELTYHYGERVVGTAALHTEKLGQLEELQEAEQDPLLQELEAERPAPEVLGDAAASEAAESAAAQSTAALDAAPAPDRTGNRKKAESGSRETSPTAGSTAETMPQEKAAEADSEWLPPLAMLVLKVVGAAVLLLLIGCLLFLHREKKEALARSRRRQQRLRHTRDLTQSQSINMDLLIQQRLRKRKRKKRR